ncbi:MAG: hypothetical protein MK100_00495 [Phycisphaerales bacterium]|nr:hypothetical protein [Phycisphaerales bacterium]
MNDVPKVLMGADGPVALEGRKLSKTLLCLGCRYDLQGSLALGRCPECGMPVPYSIAGSIDPRAHQLPPVRNPEAVGRGLVLAALAIALIATANLLYILVFHPRLPVSVEFVGSLRSGVWPEGQPYLFGTLAFLSAALGIRAWWDLRSKPGESRKGRRRLPIWMLVGLLLAAGGLVIAPSVAEENIWVVAMGPAIPLVGLFWTLLGFRGVLVEAGQRSYLFRTDDFRRQRIPSLLAGIAVTMLAWVAAGFSASMAAEITLIVSLAVALMGTLFVVIGGWYLLANALWVRSSLIHPPPKLSELFEASEGDSANLAGTEPSHPEG